MICTNENYKNDMYSFVDMCLYIYNATLSHFLLTIFTIIICPLSHYMNDDRKLNDSLRIDKVRVCWLLIDIVLYLKGWSLTENVRCRVCPCVSTFQLKFRFWFLFFSWKNFSLNVRKVSYLFTHFVVEYTIGMLWLQWFLKPNKGSLYDTKYSLMCEANNLR